MRRPFIWALVLVLAAPLHGVQARQTTAAPVQDGTARIRDINVLPGTQADAFSTIRGHVVDVTNSPLSDTVVRLRNVRTGRIVDQTLTDAAGSFIFLSVDPGSYLVEIMAPDRTSVVAASGILDGNAGDVLTTVVRVPAGPPLGGALGRTTTAAILIGVAAAGGVLAVRVAGQSVSPRG